ncbi:MAG: hypothetical protein MUF45_18080 [Spirosomaceae bacterium]|jgi:hypothetical protein|nr:hypothetical protein [Spirosomataceae bacterium]
MNNYFKNNLFEAYRLLVGVCIGIVLIATSLTTYILYSSYQNYTQNTKNTFVFSENGASIHIFSRK